MSDEWRQPNIHEARAAARTDPPVLEFHVQILNRDFWVPQRTFAADMFHKNPDRYRVPVDFSLREGYLDECIAQRMTDEFAATFSDPNGGWL